MDQNPQALGTALTLHHYLSNQLVNKVTFKYKNKMTKEFFKIASFPLNIIVLPGEEVPLRIFEPRYKQLVEECMESSLPFGIPYINENGITELGSEVEISKLVGRNSNDDMVITVRGKSVFEIIDHINILPHKLYGGALAQHHMADFSTTNPEIAVRVKTLRINLSDELGTLVVGDNINMLDIAKAIMLKSEEKYRLLSLRSKSAMERLILTHLSFIELIRSQESKLENNFQLN